MRFRPIAPDRLASELTDRIVALPDEHRAVVAIDGAVDTAALADAVVDPLRVNGRAVLRVSTADFLRPASLRYERGKQDPDARYDDWLDVGALRREVVDPAHTPDGAVLPALWDAERDRATRADRVPLPRDGIVVVDGALLLGRGLAFDLSVHLWLSAGALRRRLPEPERWTLPAYERYEREVRPAETADVVVRMHDARHPAIRD